MYISFTPILLMVVYFSTEQGLCSCTAFMLETMDLYADLLFIILFNLCKGQGSETGVCFRSDVGIVLCCRNYKLENNTCVPCPAGWWEKNCSQRCPSGQFGSFCSETCDCDKCNHVYGCRDDFNTSSTNYIELTDIENSSGNGSISGLFNLTVETWIILSSAGGLVIIISVVGVACLLWRKFIERPPFPKYL
uniref:N-acetylglucosamine-1-phosphodiester alpha-N-acetylglucosaminidase-like isoform X4 n=1 Tax=Crassostrea virginica TaxID=6565 RepID=A0A8B8EV60_CRAVI|nr:N-acetylglucosamine-1-phosphodiester alpha-N-acetylglucosaminidase-like isoform X4 [Crassostrea virginica]